MEYGRLVGDTWRIIWRNRFLWIFGIFATSPTASCNGLFGGSRTSDSGGSPEFEPPFPVVDPTAWIQENVGLVAVAGCVILLLGLAFFVLSLISQGALVHAVARIDRGEQPTFGDAWRAGRSTFWRFLGLNVLGPAAAVLVALFFTPAAILFVAGQSRGGDLGGLLVALGLIVGLAALLVVVPLWIAIAITTTFAMRAVAVEGDSLGAGLRRGIELLRRQLGTSVTLWLINMGLSFAGSLIILMLLAIPATPLVAIALVLWFAVGPTPITVAVAVLFALVLVVVLATLGGVFNAYLWSYWTLGYLRLPMRDEP